MTVSKRDRIPGTVSMEKRDYRKGDQNLYNNVENETGSRFVLRDDLFDSHTSFFVSWYRLILRVSSVVIGLVLNIKSATLHRRRWRFPFFQVLHDSLVIIQEHLLGYFYVLTRGGKRLAKIFYLHDCEGLDRLTLVGFDYSREIVFVWSNAFYPTVFNMNIETEFRFDLIPEVITLRCTPFQLLPEPTDLTAELFVLRCIK